MRSTRLIRLDEVKRRTGFQKSSIYNGIAGGTFPRPVPLGARAVAWVEDEYPGMDRLTDQRAG